MARQRTQPAPLEPGQVVELEPHGVAAGGDAVARYDGMVVFVPWVAPGDRVRARVTEVKRRFARAQPVAVVAPGPHRVEPRCPFFARCGGCRLQHLAYPQQLAWKRQMVIDALERIARIPSPPVAEAVGMDPPWHYRNKAAIPVRRLPSGRVAMGFFAAGTHQVVDLGWTGCAIQHPVIDQVIAALRRWLEEDPDGRATSTYDEARHEGLLRHLVVRVGLRSGEALAGLVVNGDGLPGEDRLARYLRREVPALVGVVKNVNRRPGNTILGPETHPLDGRPWIVDRLGGLRFRISLTSFYQVNPIQAERLYRLALDHALGEPAPGARDGDFWLIDAYAGIGTLALLAAALLRAAAARHRPGAGRWRVTAIEVVPEAVADARINAALNGLAGVEFLTGSVEEVLPRLAAAFRRGEGGQGRPPAAEAATGPDDDPPVPAAGDDRRRPDVIILDPPRKGCDPAALAACLELAPRRIVYVSCNPVTLARDLAVLCATGSPAAPPLPAAVAGSGTGRPGAARSGHLRSRYRLVSVRPVDMFPHTAHVECVALLQRDEPAPPTGRTGE
ncbi:23S rRNA (uracil(1939)-C(5))-methyltransferase RlmD [Thermaerobacter sp. FW80]|uniref:23S rRNA (uracil(1939)-C(5))-methyltransferase RlmD n=1 Tax=Thermaerobacter sp. FW80 TaxID=2546351 RepID=UPI0010756074|nr:23S rRNA (uracil(1939)-C(5))-methyltransferase RlmD [Thermaerobacter sp. FW80]QBS37464.1 23S rRNA (uracil(1939)-C(5))-methyltransferase RlmD [Thermaerobacter sp. FW80]